jgi:RNA polymerase sigma factor (sigma-70 family)
MRPGETKIGGSRESFPETAWFTVLSSPDPRDPRRRALVERLCSLYWRPVYKFVRAAWGKSVENAKDLTQEFFAAVIDSDLIARYQPAKGRFRDFLKGALRNFLAEAHRHGERQKRGGGSVTIPLDIDGVETGAFARDLQGDTPEQIYDREWAEGLMADCVKRLKEQLRSEGKTKQLRVFETYDLASADEAPPTYEELAGRLAVPVHDIRNYLSRTRGRLRELIVERISEYVASSDEIEEELQQLAEHLNR